MGETDLSKQNKTSDGVTPNTALQTILHEDTR